VPEPSFSSHHVHRPLAPHHNDQSSYILLSKMKGLDEHIILIALFCEDDINTEIAEKRNLKKIIYN
jgi:hypothetical protein